MSAAKGVFRAAPRGPRTLQPTYDFARIYYFLYKGRESEGGEWQSGCDRIQAPADDGNIAPFSNTCANCWGDNFRFDGHSGGRSESLLVVGLVVGRTRVQSMPSPSVTGFSKPIATSKVA